MRTKQKHKIKKLSFEDYNKYLSSLSSVCEIKEPPKKD